MFGMPSTHDELGAAIMLWVLLLVATSTLVEAGLLLWRQWPQVMWRFHQVSYHRQERRAQAREARAWSTSAPTMPPTNNVLHHSAQFQRDQARTRRNVATRHKLQRRRA